jgi:hypothetical protein
MEYQLKGPIVTCTLGWYRWKVWTADQTDQVGRGEGGESTPRIADMGSRYLKKNICLASIFRTLSSSVGEYFVLVVVFFLIWPSSLNMEKFSALTN